MSANVEEIREQLRSLMAKLYREDTKLGEYWTAGGPCTAWLRQPS